MARKKTNTIDSSDSIPEKAHREYTSDEIAKAIIKANGLIKAAARALRCDPQTIRNRVKSEPELAAVLAEVREQLLDNAESALAKAVTRGEGWAVCFALKTIGKPRGYVERMEQTGADGSDLTIKIKYEDTPHA